MIKILASLFVLLPLINLYFVWDGFWVWWAFQPRSRILLLLFGIKVVAWLGALPIAYVSVFALFDLRPVPFGLPAIVAGLLPLLIIPLMTHLVISALIKRRSD